MLSASTRPNGRRSRGGDCAVALHASLSLATPFKPLYTRWRGRAGAPTCTPPSCVPPVPSVTQSHNVMRAASHPLCRRGRGLLLPLLQAGHHGVVQRADHWARHAVHPPHRDAAQDGCAAVWRSVVLCLLQAKPGRCCWNIRCCWKSWAGGQASMGSPPGPIKKLCCGPSCSPLQGGATSWRLARCSASLERTTPTPSRWVGGVAGSLWVGELEVPARWGQLGAGGPATAAHAGALLQVRLTCSLPSPQCGALGYRMQLPPWPCPTNLEPLVLLVPPPCRAARWHMA